MYTRVFSSCLVATAYTFQGPIYPGRN